MKSDYRIRAEKFLNSIFPYIRDYLEDCDEIVEAIQRYNYDKHRNVRLSNGSARFCLIQSDYVVKWDYDEDAANEIGGCENEYNFYNYACDCGMGYLFAEPTLVWIEGHMFMIMPRIKHIGPDEHNWNTIDCFLSHKEWNWIARNVDDLHHYNWGLHGRKPIIIDYGYTVGM